MATVTVKNIPEELYGQLKVVAAANRRSINSEIIICIERRFLSSRPDVGELLQKARILRQLTSVNPISDEMFDEAKMSGRP